MNQNREKKLKKETNEKIEKALINKKEIKMKQKEEKSKYLERKKLKKVKKR